MYEDRFGTEDDPVIVPSLEPERIIGVTDPDDDNLVVWGVLRDNDPPRQFIEVRGGGNGIKLVVGGGRGKGKRDVGCCRGGSPEACCAAKAHCGSPLGCQGEGGRREEDGWWGRGWRWVV
eukprot:361278-Chlamydomonas_euryale.AAC.11